MHGGNDPALFHADNRADRTFGANGLVGNDRPGCDASQLLSDLGFLRAEPATDADVACRRRRISRDDMAFCIKLVE